MCVCRDPVRASSSVEGIRSALDQVCAVSSAYRFVLQSSHFCLGLYFLIVRSEGWLYNCLRTVWDRGCLSMSCSYRTCLPATQGSVFASAFLVSV